MKYLVLSTVPAIAIPLEALAAGLKFLNYDYDTEGNRVYRYADNQRVTGEIVNSSEIQPPEKDSE